MAGRSSRSFTASEVLAFLEDQEEFEAELGELVDLDGESEDEDEPEADGSRPDGSQVLLDTEVLTTDAELLTPDSGALIVLTLNSPSPAERDSILLLDPELNATGRICVSHEHKYDIDSYIHS